MELVIFALLIPVGLAIYKSAVRPFVIRFI